MIHPLINRQDSPHYDKADGKVGIEEMEKTMSIREMIGAMKYNIFKVQWRLGNKDATDKELRKIATYEAYKKVLYDLIAKHNISDHIFVNRGWEIANIKWEYK